MGDLIRATTLSAATVRLADRRANRAPAALALLCGLSLTGMLFAGVSRLEQDKIELDFQQAAHARLFALKEGIRNVIGELSSVNLLMAGTDTVSGAQFQALAQPILSRYPYVQALAHRRFGAPGGAGERNSVSEYIEAAAGAGQGSGGETSYPALDEAARERAVDTGWPSASVQARMGQQQGARLGVAVSVPVYAHGMLLDSAAARHAALRGETVIAFDPAAMAGRIYADAGLGADPGLSLRLYAGPAQEPADLMYHADGVPAGAQAGWTRWLYPAPRGRFARSVAVGGKTWLLVATPAAQAPAREHVGSLLALGLGVLLSVLGAGWMQELFGRMRAMQLRADADAARFRELSQTLLLRERVIEANPNAIVITAAQQDNPVVYVNPAFERITGYGAADVLGRGMHLLYGADLAQPGVEELSAAIREQRDGHAVLRNYRKDGVMYWNDLYISPVRDEAGNVTHFVSIQQDITAIKAYETELQHQSMHDALTGLPNRELLQDRLRQAVTHLARKSHSLWVVSIDLDRFKFTNSRLGHKGGDRLLKAVAVRLQSVVRPIDAVARVGGDEFALMLLPGPGARSPSAEQVQRVLECLAAPLLIDEQELFLSCSAGIAVYPNASRDAGELVERAEIAMYRAKEMGGNNYQFYTAAMNEQLGERMLIEGALRTALERRQFVLHYQPQVDMDSGRIVGMEALIRWQHPELGMVAPNRFVPLAEVTGLILPIGAWVIRTACEQLLAWRSQGHTGLRVAVNVSARQMAEQDFVQSVAAVLAETGLPPQCLEVELTESQVMNDVEHAIGVMHELKKLGVQLAIDDFGTGYSSLAHLKRFEIDVLKIDQTFVRDLTVDPDDAAIVTTIIALADNLKLQVISEGVETLEQMTFLQQHGCRRMQGYYFSRPVAADAFELLLAENQAQLASRSAAARAALSLVL